MTTYRERRERRVERLEEWAGKREAKSKAAAEAATEKASIIPFGQPVMPDHHSYGRDTRYRESIRRDWGKSVEHEQKAQKMQGWAESIKGQLDDSIYDDDPDAIERLRERIAALEAKRDRIKAYSASCRKGSPDVSILDDEQRKKISSIRQPFVLKNLSANIRRNKQRLEKLGG